MDVFPEDRNVRKFTVPGHRNQARHRSLRGCDNGTGFELAPRQSLENGGLRGACPSSFTVTCEPFFGSGPTECLDDVAADC